LDGTVASEHAARLFDPFYADGSKIANPCVHI
jgi:hypothetical protein